MIKSNFFMRNRRKILLIGSISLVIIIGVVLIFSTNKRPTYATQNVVEEYFEVKSGDIELTITGSGTIESSNTKDVVAEVAAKVKSVNINVGDKVKKGDILFELDTSDLETQIREKQKTITKLQKTVEEYNEDIKNLNVYSNMSGYVANLNLKVGDNVNKNNTIFEIIDNSCYKVNAYFLYNANSPINIGDNVTMLNTDSFEYITGTVTKISDYKEHHEYGGEMQEVEISVENPGYTLEGISVNQITVETQNGTKIMATDKATFEVPEKISFKAPSSGTIKTLNINNGTYITNGALVMTLENDELNENLSDAKTSLSDAYTELSDIKEDKSFYIIEAPIDGVITNLNVAVDDFVRSEATLAKIVNNAEVQFEISVDELDILDVKIGQEAKVTIDALKETTNRPLRGKRWIFYQVLKWL